MVLSLIRLADVYLMYAEAVAEGYGSATATAKDYTMNAVTAVNKIRERAGVGDVADEYLTTLDGFMSELRRERAVELAFEGHRWTDLRRWLLVDKEPYTLKKAVYFDRARTTMSSICVRKYSLRATSPRSTTGCPSSRATYRCIPNSSKTQDGNKLVSGKH